MSLAGYRGALASAGLAFDDVRFVEVGSGGGGDGGRGSLGRLWEGLDALARGKVDAVYVKGASAVEAARAHGAVLGIDLDRMANKRFRVNNGTPRPITVHQDFIDEHFELLVRFLVQTLRAASWAKTNLGAVRSVLEEETSAGAEGVETAYGEGFHLSLTPDLSSERVELFRQQKDFQLAHGLLDRDFDLDDWLDRRPLREAQRRLESRKEVARDAPLVHGSDGG